MLLTANRYTTTQKYCADELYIVLSSSLGYVAGHDSSESLRAPTSAGDTALDAAGSGQGQTPPAAELGLSLPAPEDAKEQALLARSVQEDVAKAKDSLREGQAALVRLHTHTPPPTHTHTPTHARTHARTC